MSVLQSDALADVVSIERRGRIAIVRLDRGDGRNALSMRVLRELTRLHARLTAIRMYRRSF